MLGIHLALHDTWIASTWRRWRSSPTGMGALWPEIRGVFSASAFVLLGAGAITLLVTALVQGALSGLQPHEEEGPLGDVSWFVLAALSAVKLLVLMGVPGLITLGVRRLIARVREG